MQIIISAQERLNQRLIFFYFGVAALSLASRAPEIKHNLNVSNGTFGILVSLGALGAILAFLFVGQAAHRFGVRPVLIGSTFLLYGPISVLPHVHSIWGYIATTLVIGFGANAQFIVIHDQALKRQFLSGQMALPSLHGYLSLGTFVSALLSLTITSHVSLAWHIDILMGVLWIFTMLAIYRLRSYLVTGSRKDDVETSAQSNKIWSMLTSRQSLAFAYVCAIMLEFSTNDWVTLLSKQELGASSTLSVLPYLVFILGMIIGRVGFHKLLQFKPEIYWVRVISRLGGVGFISFLLLSKYLLEVNFLAAFLCQTLAFFIAGLGGSFLAGVLTQMASQRSELPAGVVVAQLSFALTVLTFIVRLIISWVIQLSSITYGMVIPGIMLVAFSFSKTIELFEARVHK